MRDLILKSVGPTVTKTMTWNRNSKYEKKNVFLFQSIKIDDHSHVTALQKSGSTSEAVAFGTEALGVAALAVDVAVGCVTTEDRVQRSLAVPAGKAFLKKKMSILSFKITFSTGVTFHISEAFPFNNFIPNMVVCESLTL